MSNNFKPLSEQVAGRLIEQLKDGNSIFQQNDGQPLIMPFNASTGKNYRGAPALVLLLKQEPDPRWMISSSEVGFCVFARSQVSTDSASHDGDNSNPLKTLRIVGSMESIL